MIYSSKATCCFKEPHPWSEATDYPANSYNKKSRKRTQNSTIHFAKQNDIPFQKQLVALRNLIPGAKRQNTLLIVTLSKINPTLPFESLVHLVICLLILGHDPHNEIITVQHTEKDVRLKETYTTNQLF